MHKLSKVTILAFLKPNSSILASSHVKLSEKIMFYRPINLGQFLASFWPVFFNFAFLIYGGAVFVLAQGAQPTLFNSRAQQFLAGRFELSYFTTLYNFSINNINGMCMVIEEIAIFVYNHCWFCRSY